MGSLLLSMPGFKPPILQGGMPWAASLPVWWVWWVWRGLVGGSASQTLGGRRGDFQEKQTFHSQYNCRCK